MSEIRATTISDAAGTGPITLTGQSAAKAWVNWENKSTLAVLDSVNTSSVTDNGVGISTVNFSSGWNNIHYAASGIARKYDDVANATVTFHPFDTDTLTTSAFKIRNHYGGGYNDADNNMLSFHGDLA